MKLFVGFVFLCLWTVFSAYGKEDVLSTKVHQLMDWSLKKPVIRLNTERFNHYVKTSPRNYSMIVMLTALSPQRQCAVCKQAHDEFEVVAQSYRYSNAFSDKVFFGMVDFDEGSEVFQYLKLNSAPVFIHFPPNTKPKKGDQMDISRSGFTAEQVAKWVNERTEISIQISRPVNYSRILLIGFLVTLLGGLLYLKRNSLDFLYNYIFWGVFVILAISFFISGQVWNHIRAPPFVHRNQKTGEVSVVCYFISGQTWNLINGPPFMSKRKDGMEIFANDSNMQFVAETYIGLFSGTTGYQFVAETYIVFLLYFGVSAGVILLNEAPTLRVKTGKQKTIVAIVGMLMVIFLFSYILSIFRSKYQGYPYSFLIK